MLWREYRWRPSPQEGPTFSGSQRQLTCHPGVTQQEERRRLCDDFNQAGFLGAKSCVGFQQGQEEGRSWLRATFQTTGPMDGTSWPISCWYLLSPMTHCFHQLLITSFPSEALIVIYTLAEFLPNVLAAT